jgi:hypothetical protein
MSKTNHYRREIMGFTQQEGEQFHETWERFNDLLRLCPHHQVPRWQLVERFYNGLSERHRQTIDAACAGTFMTKTEDEA